jgi:tetratricopeptide (TPR) repeat protein
VTENRVEEARETLWRLFHAFPKADVSRVDFLFRLTVFDVQAFDPQHAVDQLLHFAAADPADMDARCALAFYYLRLGNIDSARELIHQLNADRADHPRVRNAFLEYLVTTGDRMGLQNALSTRAGFDGNDSGTWKYCGIDHENRGEFEQAVECYRNAAKLNPRDYASRARLAQALRLAGDNEEHREESEAVAKTGRLLSELSDFASRLPNNPGNRVTHQHCLAFAEMCAALGWEAEATAWTELAQQRQESPFNASPSKQRSRPMAGTLRGGGQSP